MRKSLGFAVADLICEIQLSTLAHANASAPWLSARCWYRRGSTNSTSVTCDDEVTWCGSIEEIIVTLPLEALFVPALLTRSSLAENMICTA